MPYRKILCPTCNVNKINPLSKECRTCWTIQIRGCGNNNYKGTGVGYTALHGWVKRRKPSPLRCELCGEIRLTELALKAKSYTRNINNYWHLCRRCHMMTDGRSEVAVRNMWAARNEKLEDGC